MEKNCKLLIISACLLYLACASTKEKDTLAPPVKNDFVSEKAVGMPPGAANITAEVIDYEEVGQRIHCRLQVLQVHGYGAGTPPLPVGTELVVLVRGDLLESGAGERDVGELLAKGNTLETMIQHQDAPSVSASSVPSWRMLSIQ